MSEPVREVSAPADESARPSTSFEAGSLVGPALVLIGAAMWGLETYWRKRLLPVFAPDVLVFHEHLIGTVLTLPFLIRGWKRIRHASKKAWLSMLASGVLGSAFGTICFTYALGVMNASVANLLLNVQPVVSVFVAWFWLSERPRAAFYPWAAVALVCGLALAWSPGELGPSKNLGMGLLAITGTAICWGASTTFGRGAMLEIDFASGAAVRYVIGTVATFLIVLRQGAGAERMHWEALTQWSVARDMGELLIVAAITPTFIYFAGLARTRASVATFAEMGQTFASLLITWGILGDALSSRQLVSGVVLLTAVYFINRSVDSPTPTVKEQLATE